MYIFSSLLATLFLLIFTKWIWDRRRLYSVSWNLPGPFSVPFIGSAFSLLYQDILIYLDKISAKYATPVKLWLGTQLFIYIDNADDIETILASPECINRSYQYIQEALGVDGIFTLEGKVWRQHRKIVSPSFNYNVVLGYLPVFNRNAKTLIQQIASKCNEAPFDVRDFIKFTALDSFLEATLGTSMSADDKKLYSKFVTIGQEIVSRRVLRPWFHLDWVWNLTPYPKILADCRKFSHRIIDNIMAQYLLKGSSEMTMIERLLRISEENENFSLDDVKAEAIDALTAASDTSSWAISFVILMLAIHPECQQRVVDELKHVCMSKDSEIERHDVENLQYMEMCINETLRLFPVISMIVRKCAGSIRLRDVILPSDVEVAIGVRQVHRSKQYWGDRPDDFDPEHFRPENVRKRHPSCYLPFSLGPRNCIGSTYAMIVMKSMAANLLRNFHFTTPLKMTDLKVRLDINIFLENGHMVQAVHRDF